MEAVIYGAGEIGAIAARILKNENSVEIIGFLDDRPESSGRTVEGLKIIGDSSDLARFRRFGAEAICIACRDGRERIRLAELAEKTGYYILSVRSSSSYLSPDAYTGRGCIILEGARIGSGAMIQHCCLIGRGVQLDNSMVVPAGINLFKEKITTERKRTEEEEKDSVQDIHFTTGGAIPK
ncbi:MAG: hypothetical protein GF417_05420 [Candidatus Latescibacteria bacterium]|nr:hypothetical protein [bacterium]MBD3423855.1 hypothetical protein [Candidatus Latescibacterota bacterium]